MESDKPAGQKKTRFPDEIVQECLRTLDSGEAEDLFEIIPRLGVLRDPRFNEPLLALLSDKDTKKRQFAAHAMGAIGRHAFLEPLKKAFLEARRMRGFGAEEFLIAIIEAIGAVGDDAAVEFFLPVFKETGDPERTRKLRKWILESLGAIAQQGGERSVAALVELTRTSDPEVCAQALSELSVAYWHRPNDIADTTLQHIHQLTRDRHQAVAESALFALQSLADVGCLRAEKLFSPKARR